MAWKTLVVRIRGVSPYVPCRFSTAAAGAMEELVTSGQRSRTKHRHEQRDPEQEAESRLYRDEKGRYGIPTAALRKAMIEAGRFSDFKMTRLKGALDVVPETYDADTGMGLALLESPEPPKLFASPVRLADGSPDIRYRKYFAPGWTAKVCVQYDDEILTEEDVRTLLRTAGMNVGIGDGRPLSPNSAGMSYGRFEVVD